jgi:hypothetical protein
MTVRLSDLLDIHELMAEWMNPEDESDATWGGNDNIPGYAWRVIEEVRVELRAGRLQPFLVSTPLGSPPDIRPIDPEKLAAGSDEDFVAMVKPTDTRGVFVAMPSVAAAWPWMESARRWLLLTDAATQPVTDAPPVEIVNKPTSGGSPKTDKPKPLPNLPKSRHGELRDYLATLSAANGAEKLASAHFGCRVPRELTRAIMNEQLGSDRVGRTKKAK